MTTKKGPDFDQELFRDELTRMRQDIEALTASMKKLAEAKNPTITPDEEGSFGGLHGLNWEDLQHTYEEMRKRGDKLFNDVAEEVKQHPLRSAAVALGAGFIIAKLFGRRRS